MPLRSAVLALAAIGSWWALAPSALALQPGVHVDPGSPASKEYSFPLSVQRAASVGLSGQAGQPQPLFGVGISTAGLAVGARAGGSSKRSRAYAPIGSPGPIRGARRIGAAGSPGAAALARLTRRGSPAPDVALIGLPVVLGGVALGGLVALVRRRLR